MATWELCSRRGFAVALGAMWAVVSLTQGGLSTSWRALRHPEPVIGTDPRHLASGPYFEALDALASLPGQGDTVAVVLAEGDLLGSGSAVRLYETIYRLYPVRPNFYFRGQDGSYHQWWFEGRPGETPQGTKLWDHRFVLRADGGPISPPENGQLVWSNSAATVYHTG